METLSLNETRVIGALIEKENTTPDYYPMTLNSLTAACNQKSNREPVLSLTEDEIQDTIDSLIKKRLVIRDESRGSRVAKIRHRFCNTEFSQWKFTPQQLGIITLLFLRGPQTPGELRTRTNRLCQFSDVQEVETVLDSLINHELNPFVTRLPREAGKSACRYAHLFSGEITSDTAGSEIPATDPQARPSEQSDDRLSALETEVTQLKNQITALTDRLAALEGELS